MKISNEVADVIASSKVEGDKLYLPDTQLDRKLYTSVNKVLVAIGGKWNRSAKAHIFKTDIEEIIEEILASGEYTSEKKDFQFFETPPDVVDQLLDLADIRKGELVLEPSAGKGRIASRVPCCDCVELNPINREYLKSSGYNVVGEDFLEFSGEYDVIIANPPFSKQQDISHIIRMVKLAKRRVVSVASASILFRTNKKTEAFRKFVDDMGGTITPLPEKSFSKSGTNVNTCIVCIDI
jgi:type I restriction-modification system DNA methylase subunit